MNIGIVCYASVGGSGIIATELGKTLARARPRRPHPEQRHAGPARRLSARPLVPSRRDARAIRCSASRSTCCRSRTRSCRWRAHEQLDIVHAHYAIPHATAAYLARQILAATRPRRACRGSSRRCTAPTSRCSAAIRRTRRSWRSASSSPTASPPCRRACKADTYRELGVTRDIRVIPNFSTAPCTSAATRRRSRARLGAERREDR